MEEKTTIVIDVQLDQSGVADKLAAVNREMAALRAENAAMKKSVKEGKAEWEDVSQALAQNEARLKSLKASQSALSSQVVQATHQQLEYGTSLKEQSALLTELRTRYQSLSKTERESAQGQQLLKHIQDLDAAIKQADYSQGQFQRNVGNYPGAMQPLQEELARLTQQLEALRSENKQGTEEFAKVEQQIDGVRQSIAALDQSVQGVGQDVRPLKTQLKEMTDQLIQMKMSGQENTEQYRQLLEQVGTMKDAMMDASNEIKQMASDTGALNSVLAGAQAAAGGFSAALGVMNLLGDKDSETAKEMAEAQVKLQSAIAITTGLQAVQNALQKESALMMGVAKVRILAATAAQKLYAAATRDAQAAQAVFNKVAKSNIYVWLAGIILSVVGAVAAFTRGSKEQEEQLESTNRELQTHAQVLQGLIEDYRSLRSSMDDYYSNAVAKAKAQGKSVEEIRKIEDEEAEFRKQAFLDEQDRLKKEIQAYTWYKDEIAKNIKWIESFETARTSAMAAGDTERAQYYQNEIDYLRKVNDSYREHVAIVDDFNQRWSDYQVEMAERAADRQREDEAAAKKAAEEAKRRSEEIIQRLRNEREEIKRNREELRKANEELLGFVDELKNGLAPQGEKDFFDKLREKYEAVDKAAQEAKERHELLRRYILETKGLDIDAKLDDSIMEKLERQSNPLYNFLQSYQENAQAIQETSSALESSFGSLSSMYQKMAQDETKTEEERERAARKAKAWSKIQVAANAGTAIAKGVASAVDVGFPAAIPAIANMTGTVIAAIAQAKAMLSEAFETGGVIGGYHGASMGRDNTAVIARRGEMVLNANQQRQLFELANGGAQTGGMYSALAQALANMPAPVLVYSEFQRFTDRVATLDDAAKLQ